MGKNAAKTHDPIEQSSTTVKRIDNGYVVQQSRWKDGNYTSSEHFVAERPSIADEKPKGPDAGSESMRDAIRYLK